ncbi:MAG: hypothetical protein ABIB11_05965 [Candidatus Omnitrophota bacterium]
MSTKKEEQFGNDTIHRYPPLKGLRLEKILIVKREVLKVLKSEFLIFKKLYRKNSKKTEKPNTNVKSQKITPQKPYYEPSNMHYAYNSDYWRWQRVKEWFKYYSQTIN